jgi:hypothetical protein
MASVAGVLPDRIVIRGESRSVVERLTEPLYRALSRRPALYRVNIDAVGRVGEVVVSIEGSKGRLPLLFGKDELEPGFVFRVVDDAIRRYDF